MAFYMKPGRGPMMKTGRGIDTVALMKGNPLQQENNTAKRKAEGVDPTEEEFKKTLATHKITKPNNAVKKVVKKVVKKKVVKKKVLKPASFPQIPGPSIPPAPFPTSSFGENLTPKPAPFPVLDFSKMKNLRNKNK